MGFGSLGFHLLIGIGIGIGLIRLGLGLEWSGSGYVNHGVEWFVYDTLWCARFYGVSVQQHRIEYRVEDRLCIHLHLLYLRSTLTYNLNLRYLCKLQYTILANPGVLQNTQVTLHYTTLHYT